MNDSARVARDGDKPSLFELEKFLPYQLSLLTNTISAGIARSYRNLHEISVIEWRIMAVLGRYPGLTASEIGERTAMEKVPISRAVKNLEARGLLERTTDRCDRRRQRLQLSPGHGSKMLEEIIPLAKRYETQLLDALSTVDQRVLGKILQKLQTKARILNS